MCKDPGRRAALLARVRAAADRLCRYQFATWHYGDSVGFEGLLAATDLLADGRYEGFVHGAVKAWIGRATPYRELDNTAPGHAMCLVYERTGDAAILEAARSLAEHLAARRTIGGAFVSFERAPLRRPYGDAPLSAEEERLLHDPGPGVFVDTLHFDPPFFTHLGALTGSTSLTDLGAHQAVALVELLQRSDTGLFSHFYLERTGTTYGHGWGRGQGWALLGLLDVIDHLPDEHPTRQSLLEALHRLVEGLAVTQAADGHWPTPIDDRDSFRESSTALFAAAGLIRAIGAGHIDAAFGPVAHRAWSAGLGRVAVDGAICGVSAALWAATSQSHYSAAPIGSQVPWGQGPFLLAARELLRESTI